MTIYYAFDTNGAFVVGDTVSGITGRASNDSVAARDAREFPARVAARMIRWRLEAGTTYDPWFDDPEWDVLARVMW